MRLFEIRIGVFIFVLARVNWVKIELRVERTHPEKSLQS
jgi:hypothetical protein